MFKLLKIFSQGLSLPSDTNMRENEFKRVEEVISNLLKN
jgi:dTDP-4-amino-4,6-dideoxygalactose transaminase